MPTSNQNWTWQCDRVIANDAVLGRRLLDDLLGQLETLHWSRREIFGVHLAVDEALVNAIHHGNADDTAKRVQFSARVCPTKVHIEIVDEGPGFDPDRLPDPTAPERLGCPGGRGVLLMRAFMSHVEFRDRGSRVVLEKERSM
ncbi:MAG: ATP-binding protein [Planctomycetaceae bacterium]|nr:ATP-binding protein [Planctomycetaceae bacterium]